MTTAEIRRNVHVNGQRITSSGIWISYMIKGGLHGKNWYTTSLELGHEKAIEELTALDEIQEVDNWESSKSIKYEDEKYYWSEFAEAYELSQWVALSLVIKHELQKDAALEKGDVGKSINNLLDRKF